MDRAKQYALIRYTLLIIETVYLLAFLFLFYRLGLSSVLAEAAGVLWPKYFSLPVYLLGIYLTYYLLSLPLNFYHSFILEHKFSLSTQKIGDWLKDEFKGCIIAYLTLVILAQVFYYVLAHYPSSQAWLALSLCWMVFSIVLAKLTPLIIIPLFFKYTRLSDGDLRERIIKLAQKMKLGALDVFQIDFSKKTLKANAALVGIGRSRRVLLADTLKDRYTPQEVEVILAHEFAHHKLRHLAKLILINALLTFTAFYLLFRDAGFFRGLFNLTHLTDLAGFPILVLYFTIYGILTQPLQNYLSRVMERNADRMALRVTGSKAAFISVMDKLASQNLADRNPHPVIKFLFFDHPAIEERIDIAVESEGL